LAYRRGRAHVGNSIAHFAISNAERRREFACH
jgi:hypothetical protein